MGGSLGRQSGHGIVAFGGERFSAGDRQWALNPLPAKARHTARMRCAQRMTRQEASAEKDER